MRYRGTVSRLIPGYQHEAGTVAGTIILTHTASPCPIGHDQSWIVSRLVGHKKIPKKCRPEGYGFFAKKISSHRTGLRYLKAEVHNGKWQTWRKKRDAKRHPSGTLSGMSNRLPPTTRMTNEKFSKKARSVPTRPNENIWWH
eukprot:g38545.t1